MTAAAKTDKGDGDLLKDLRAAAKGLLFPSETDAPVKAVRWAGAAPASGADEAAFVAALRAAAKVPEATAVKTLPASEFFAPVVEEKDWFGPEEKERARGFRDLLALLESRLTGVRAYRVTGAARDESVVDAYVVGRTESGDLSGVSTRLVET